MIRKVNFALIAVLALAAALRIYDFREIGFKFWDEVHYVSEARAMPALSGSTTGFKAGNLLFFWAANPVLGRSAQTSILVSILTGILTCLVLYFTGKRLFSRRTGLWAALVFAVLNFSIHYSRSALVESNLLFLISLTVLALAYWPRYWVVCLTGLLAGWTFSTNQKAGFILFLPFLLESLRWLRREPRGPVGTLLLRQALFIAPSLAVFFAINAVYPPTMRPFDHADQFFADLLQAAHPGYLFLETGLIGPVFILLFAAGFVPAIRRAQAAGLFLVVWFTLLFFIWSFNCHLEPRDFTGLIPAFALLAGLGGSETVRWFAVRLRRSEAITGLVLGLLVAAYGVFASRETWQLKSDVLPMARFINAHNVPGVVCGHPLYTLYGIPVYVLDSAGAIAPATLDSLAYAGWMFATDYMLGKAMLDSPPAWFNRLQQSAPEFGFTASVSVHLPTVLETFSPERARRIIRSPWAREIRLYALKNGAPFSD
ncbi:MAG: glycosyltransferase family 39 protein [Fibrobacterota bacterium]